MPAMSHMLRGLLAQTYGEGGIGEGMAAAERIAPSAEPSARVQLCLLQLLLPDLVAAIEKIIVSATDKPRVRQVAGGLLTYVYNPLDLIGDDSPLGRVDDAIICAVGLQHLREAGEIDLDPDIAAVCDWAARSLPLLSSDLQDSIRWFVRDLEQQSGSNGSRVEQ